MKTSTDFRPCSIAAFAAVSEADCAAKGVDFLEPLKPSSPADAQEMVLPNASETVTIVLLKVLKRAFANFNRADERWLDFVKRGDYHDFALFMSLKRKYSYAPFTHWETPYKNCEKQAIEKYCQENEEEILFWQFTQYIFLKQWNDLRNYAHAKGVSIMGDMPIYLASDSVETWKYRDELFILNEKGETSMRAGVPPDAFSQDGQLWGNPVYDWDKMKKNGYAWWKERILSTSQTAASRSAAPPENRCGQGM